MKDSKVLKTILVVAGLIVVGFGAAVLFTPIAFYATNGIALGDNVSVLNEIRAAGGFLMASGLVIISGAIWRKLAFTATVLATVLYLAYGLSRLLSLIVDGLPAQGLQQAMYLEFVIGVICLLALIRYRE